MKKNMFKTITFFMLSAFWVVGAQEKIGQFVTYEDYYIGSLMGSSQICTVDVRALHLGKANEYYVIITKQSGSRMKDQSAWIGYQDFLEFQTGLETLSALPLPESDFWERRYTCGDFSFGYGPVGNRNALVYFMTIDSSIPDSTVIFNLPSEFKEVFLLAAKKLMEIIN